ncbi:hypothetical protein L4F92_02630 [Avibacterium sp. 21-595]|uniref:hypothetical protein n=1 Tax=Avibacterium sp. 21-595 TaxID=2911527 RepID=UPI0020272085|nr:hypothetical protein [Avibacterium sp. 21-595]URL07027.1 hypothetical protein L4F92_02630 [Avibacterium sp. 21-595]
MAINLLPWRLATHHKNVKKLLIRAGICLVISLAGQIMMRHVLHAEQAIAPQKNEQYESLSQRLAETIEQINALRQNYVSQQEQQPLPAQNIVQFLNWLAALPLQQGELNEVSLTQQKLLLSGFTENQQEFEQLQQRITQLEQFNHSQLTQFQPTGSQLTFEFQLSNEQDDDATF